MAVRKHWPAADFLPVTACSQTLRPGFDLEDPVA